jgi:cell division protein FtsI (penicillin-binding protein 3)
VLASPERRMRVGLLALLFVITIFVGRLFQIQGLDAQSLTAEAVAERTVTVALPANRGDIVDRHGAVLATTLERRNVTVDQQLVPLYSKVVDDKRVTVGVPGAAADIAVLLGETPEAVAQRLTGTLRYKVVAKGVTPETWRRIALLGVPGVLSEQTSLRTYPGDDVAAATIGFMGKEGRALGGLELSENAVLAGRAGSVAYERSKDGLAIPTGVQSEVPPVAGQTLRLTFDRDIQWKAQSLLADAVAATRAEAGYAVVQDVRTGEVLAMANAPTFDANDPAGADQSDLLNRTITDIFEPGSTSKVVTAAAALQEGVATPRTKLVVDGRIHRGGKYFNDSHVHPPERLTFAGVIAQSSNVGTIMVGEKVAPTKLYGYMRAFGLGQKTGLGPGESGGIVAPPDTWSNSQRYTVLFGQGLAVTAVQATSVFATVANNGVRVAPRVIDATVAPDGTVTKEAAPSRTRVISAKTAKTLSRMLENVVGEEGTAEAAMIPGYRVAGKTGTAQAPDKNGGYRGYTASFIGFAPADKPRLAVSVILQRPTKGHYGGVVAAPVFQQIMTYALAHEQIPPSGVKAPKLPLTY